MRCLNCEFYNQPDAPFCLDCGALDFTEEVAFGEEEPLFRLHSIPFVLTSTLAVLIITVVVTLSDNPDDLFSNSAKALIFALLGSFAIATFYKSAKNIMSDIARDKKKAALANVLTLRLIEDEINYKVHLFIEENTDLINLFAPVDEEDEKDGIEYVETNETEKRLYETVEVRLGLYQMQLNEIDLIRLEGEIFYCRETPNDFVEEADDSAAIEDLFESLKDLENSYDLDENNGYLNLFSAKEEIFLEKVETARKLCESVRDELIKKKDALRGQTQYLPQPTAFSGKQEFTNQQLADYDIKRILNDYSRTFGELESEYNRLKSLSVKSGNFTG